MESQPLAKPLPYFFIGKERTSERINNYKLQKHEMLTQALGRPDTRSVWYSKDHLWQLIREIEEVGGDGLRFLFGAYEAGHEYGGQTCLVMVVTRAKPMGDEVCHENVVLEDVQGYDLRKEATKDFVYEEDSHDQSEKPKGFNHGSPCPPLCDFGEGFEYP